jgi:hypothetical protein
MTNVLDLPEERRATEAQRRWLWSSFKSRFFTRRHSLRFKDEHQRWREVALLLHLSRAARGRLEWIIFWEKNDKNATLTARHFGIARKTFYKWLARFEKDFIRGLEEGSRLASSKKKASIHNSPIRKSRLFAETIPPLRQDETSPNLQDHSS